MAAPATALAAAAAAPPAAAAAAPAAATAASAAAPPAAAPAAAPVFGFGPGIRKHPRVGSLSSHYVCNLQHKIIHNLSPVVIQ